MKIALVALPRHKDVRALRIAPPLPLGYLAALLEQRRHIVRVYDLALGPPDALSSVGVPLGSFRPQLVLFAADTQGAAAPVAAALEGFPTTVVYLGHAMRDCPLADAARASELYLREHPAPVDEQSLILDIMKLLQQDVDRLPYPARHLLSLEQYPLMIGREMQTTVLLGAHPMRSPQAIIAELQSVIREHGVGHILFEQRLRVGDMGWLEAFLHALGEAALAIRWELAVDYAAVSPQILEAMRASGCEAIAFELVASEDLISRAKRALLVAITRAAHRQQIAVHAEIMLDPPYNALPDLIDISATLGLDTVQFRLVLPPLVEQQDLSEDMAAMALERYRERRSRQMFVDRFGRYCGPLLWWLGRLGLFGPVAQHYAAGLEEQVAVS